MWGLGRLGRLECPPLMVSEPDARRVKGLPSIPVVMAWRLGPYELPITPLPPDTGQRLVMEFR